MQIELTAALRGVEDYLRVLGIAPKALAFTVTATTIMVSAHLKRADLMAVAFESAQPIRRNKSAVGATPADFRTVEVRHTWGHLSAYSVDMKEGES